MLYCGNNEQAKQIAARLIRDIGFEPADVGRSRSPGTSSHSRSRSQLAYEIDGGPEIAYRIERFGKKNTN